MPKYIIIMVYGWSDIVVIQSIELKDLAAIIFRLVLYYSSMPILKV